MNIAVIGAAGGTGTHVVNQALAAGHSVTALVRSPEKMAVTDPKLRIVQGDATDQASMGRALEGEMPSSARWTLPAPSSPMRRGRIWAPPIVSTRRAWP